MEKLDNSTPGGVYLCQINETISCGACCGLYNISDLSYDKLLDMLTYRTELYKKTPKDYDSLEAFQEIIRDKERNYYPFSEFHHCHYIGLIGENEDRPGCLLHPYGKGNNNVDHRGLSHWGGFACASYFCPTCSQLPSRYKEILRISVNNWYIYGLIVTETNMLDNLFFQIEKAAGRNLTVEEFDQNDQLQKSMMQFFELKNNWKYRQKNFQRTGNYFFKDDLYPRKIIDYQNLGVNPSPYNEILLAFGSEFNSTDELEEAVEIVSILINNIVSLMAS